MALLLSKSQVRLSPVLLFALLQLQPVESDDSEGNFVGMRAVDLTGLHPGPFNGADDMGSSIARSRMALREWVLEEYEMTGLTRKLTQLDIQVGYGGALH